jgi:hypothetical protein
MTQPIFQTRNMTQYKENFERNVSDVYIMKSCSSPDGKMHVFGSSAGIVKIMNEKFQIVRIYCVSL